jgi:hypothetical protein
MASAGVGFSGVGGASAKRWLNGGWMGIPAHGEQRLDPGRQTRLHIGSAESAVIAEHDIGLAQSFGQGVDFGQHRLELLLVVGGLDDGGGDHQQTALGDDGLSVVALLEAAAGNRHDAGLFIGEIDLIRSRRPFDRRFSRLAAGLLARILLLSLARSPSSA